MKSGNEASQSARRIILSVKSVRLHSSQHRLAVSANIHIPETPSIHEVTQSASRYVCEHGKPVLGRMQSNLLDRLTSCLDFFTIHRAFAFCCQCASKVSTWEERTLKCYTMVLDS